MSKPTQTTTTLLATKSPSVVLEKKTRSSRSTVILPSLPVTTYENLLKAKRSTTKKLSSRSAPDCKNSSVVMLSRTSMSKTSRSSAALMTMTPRRVHSKNSLKLSLPVEKKPEEKKLEETKKVAASMDLPQGTFSWYQRNLCLSTDRSHRRRPDDLDGDFHRGQISSNEELFEHDERDSDDEGEEETAICPKLSKKIKRLEKLRGIQRIQVPSSKKLADTCMSLFTLYKQVDRLEAALSCLREGCEIHEKICPFTERLGETYLSLALLCGQLGNFEESKKFYLKRCEIQECTSPRSPQLLASYRIIADLCRSEGKLTLSQDYLQKAERIVEENRYSVL